MPISKSYYLELASTPTQREFGLMYRSQLPVQSGMIFVYPNEAPRTFWMKNTIIPLDIIFLDKNLAIQGVSKNATPYSLSPRAVSGIKSRYVVELSAGSFDADHLQAGDILQVSTQLPDGEPGA